MGQYKSNDDQGDDQGSGSRAHVHKPTVIVSFRSPLSVDGHGCFDATTMLRIPSDFGSRYGGVLMMQNHVSSTTHFSPLKWIQCVELVDRSDVLLDITCLPSLKVLKLTTPTTAWMTRPNSKE